MAKKKPKDVQPSGPFGPIFLGAVAAVLGAGLAFFQLAGKSPENNIFFVEVNTAEFANAESEAVPPSDENATAEGLLARRPEVIRYIKGKSSGGRNWKAKRESLVSGAGALQVTIPEVNTWLRSNFKLSSDDAGGLLALVPSTPQVAATEDLLHIYMPVQVHYLGRRMNTTLISKGTLKAGGNGLQYVPRDTYFGSSPVPSAIAAILQSKFLRAFRASEEYEALREPLASIASVEVSPGGISLQR